MEPGSIHTERLILIPVTSKVVLDLSLGSTRTLEEMGLQTKGRWPRQDTLDILPFVAQAFQKNPESTGFEFWMVVHQESMTIIGDIGFRGIPDGKGIVEIGYGLIEEAQRKGYGYEAMQAMMDWAKSHKDVKAIRADCLVTNVPSIRILEKSGMKRIHRAHNTIYWEYQNDSIGIQTGHQDRRKSMFKPFGKHDRILHERPFLDSEVPFHVVHRIAEESDALLLHSEDRKVIIAESDPEKPMWIWVDQRDMKGSVNQVILEMEHTFKRRESVNLVSTPEFFDAFLKSYPCPHEKQMVMEAYECREVTLSKGSAIITLPSLTDSDTIAAFCAGFLSDALGIASSPKSQLEEARALILSGNLHVLKEGEEIVAMANIAHRSARHARINNVYTPPSHRKKGYASLLVAALSRRILSEGLIPVLYTDLTNETSNKIYQEIGYKPCGKVDQYRIGKVQED